MGLFWPIPEVGHPGTPRLYEGGKFFHPDGKARFHGVPYRPSAEVVDDEYPMLAHHRPGRVSQYLSGTQTRRIAALVDQYPEPLCEMHPHLAERLGIADGDLVTVTSRRGTITLPAHVVATIRPDTVFIPYHWPGDEGREPAHQPGRSTRLSKMPEFKVAAVRVERAGGRRHRPMTATPTCTIGRAGCTASTSIPVFVIDQSRCIGCEACVQACMECGTHRGQSLIHLERSTAPRPPRPRRWCACTARTPPAHRCAPPTRSSRPRAASCSRR